MEELEGSRSGSTLYLYNGFLYLRNKTRNNVTYYRCRETQCSVLASTSCKSNIVQVNGDHEHSPPVQDVEDLRLRSALRRAVKQDMRPVRKIFEEMSMRFPLSKLEFSAVCTQLCRTRRRNTESYYIDSEAVAEDQADFSSEGDLPENPEALNVESGPNTSTSEDHFPAPEVVLCQEPDFSLLEPEQAGQVGYAPSASVSVAESIATETQYVESGESTEKQTSTIKTAISDMQTTAASNTMGVKIKPINTLKSKTKEEDDSPNVNISAKTLESAIQRLELVSNKLTAVSLVDSYDQFGKYITTVLRGLPVRKVHYLKQKIISEVMEVLAQEQSVPPKNIVPEDAQANINPEQQTNLSTFIVEQSQPPNFSPDPNTFGAKIPIRGSMPVLYPGIFTPSPLVMTQPTANTMYSMGSTAILDTSSLIGTTYTNTTPAQKAAALQNVNEGFRTLNVTLPTAPAPVRCYKPPSQSRWKRIKPAEVQVAKKPCTSRETPSLAATVSSDDDSNLDKTQPSKKHGRTRIEAAQTQDHSKDSGGNAESNTDQSLTNLDQQEFEMDIVEGDELARIKQDQDMFETVICGESSNMYIKEEAPDPDDSDSSASPTCHLCNAKCSSQDELTTHFSTAHPGHSADSSRSDYHGT